MMPACPRGWFPSSFFYSLFVSTFVSTLYMVDSSYIGVQLLMFFVFPFLMIITNLAFFDAVDIRLFDKHLVYSIASVFGIISSDFPEAL